MRGVKIDFLGTLAAENEKGESNLKINFKIAHKA